MTLFDSCNLPPQVPNAQSTLNTLKKAFPRQSHHKCQTSPATGEIGIFQSGVLCLGCLGCVYSLCHNIQPKQQQQQQQQCLVSRNGFIICIKTTTMTEQYNPSTDNTSEKKHTLNHPSRFRSTNRARQEVHVARSQSPGNINKALPPVPPFDSSISRPPQSVTTNSSSFAHSQDTTHCPSPASNVSSAQSRSSRKTEFRTITRGLVHPDTAGGSITLSSVQPDMYGNLAKYDPANPPKSPRT